MPKKTLTKEKRDEEVRLGDEAECDKDLSLLKWGKKYLPEHFAHPPSAMHVWLGEQLDAMGGDRGSKINLIGPRGSAKSTVVTLVLRVARGGGRLGTVYLDCFRYGRPGEGFTWIICGLSSTRMTQLKRVYGESAEARPALAKRRPFNLRNNVIIESYGTGQGIAGTSARGSSADADCVRRSAERFAHRIGPRSAKRSRRWFHGTLLNAGTPDTNIVNLATALHRDALALELSRTPGWTSRTFRGDRSVADEHRIVEGVGGDLLRRR